MNKIPIKVINLERRPDRLKKFEDEMHKHGITEYSRFDAIDGTKLEVDQRIVKMFMNNNFGWRRCVMGVALSHIELWRELVQSSHNYYLIFEDDITLIDNFQKYFEILSVYINEAVYPFIFLGYHTDSDELKKPSFYSKLSDNLLVYPLHKKGHIWGGLFGYIIHRNFAKKLLNDIGKNGIVEPIDTFVLEKSNLFTTYPTMVESEFMTFTNLVDSDIQYDLLSIFDEYEFFSQKDSSGGDIKCVYVKTFDEIVKICDNNPNCIGFNTYGYLKKSICHPDDFTDLPDCNSKSHGLYIKRSYLEKIGYISRDGMGQIDKIGDLDMGAFSGSEANTKDDMYSSSDN